MKKITVVGAGSVGSTIAYTLAVTGIASEVVMVDINTEKALGEALDIRQATPFSNPANVYAGNYCDAAGSDIVVITSGVPRKAGQSRLDLAQINVDILKSITNNITKYAPDATYVIVSNPVDVLTYAFCKYSGIPEERVIGSGTILDTARLRSRIAEYYSINQQNVHAYILGEHGDSAFVPWSTTSISNIPVDEYAAASIKNVEYPEFIKEEVEEYVRTSGARIISRKGATFYGVAMAVCHLCDCLLRSANTVLTVATMMHGEYGVEDVCLSIPTVVGDKRVHNKLLLPLTDEEVAAFHASADSLKNVIQSIKL